MAKEFKKGKMVPVPSHSIVPERDVNKLPVLECQHLGIDFGGLTAVNEFNLTIGRTEIAGLIGPNGAGKSTLMRIMAGLSRPSAGSVRLGESGPRAEGPRPRHAPSGAFPRRLPPFCPEIPRGHPCR